MDLGTATIVGSVAGAIVVGVASIAATVITSRQTRKATGVAIETGLAVVSQQLADHAAENRREFGAANKRIDEVADDNKDQWSRIHEHTASIGFLQGKSNGKAAGAHG